MASYGCFGAYYSMCEGVRALIGYEKRVEKVLDDNFKENGISKLILEYYDMYREYEYCSGKKTPDD